MSEQLNFRIDASDKTMLKNAASAEGKSLSEFIRNAAIKEAEQLRDERINGFDARIREFGAR